MPSNTPETQALLPVTAADVDAALATFDGGLVRQNDERNARGYTTFYHPKDSMRAVLEEFSARQSSSNAGGVDPKRIEDCINAAIGHGEHGIFVDVAKATESILASLSTPTAEPPSPCPGDVGTLLDCIRREGLWGHPGLHAAVEAVAAITTPPTPDRIGKDAVREALVEHFPNGVRGLFERTAQGMPVRTHVGTDCSCGWCTAATDEHEVRQQWAEHVAAALSAIPAQEGEGDD